MRRIVLTITALLGLAACATAEEEIVDARIRSEKAEFRLLKLVDGIPNPWGFAFLPDGDILITQRSGRLWRLGKESALEEIAASLEVRAAGQGGLLDIVLHPDYSANGWIYLSHVVSTPPGNATAVSRGRLAGNRLTDIQRIFTANGGGRTTRHFGSRLVFDDEGYLFITLGDRGEMNRAQDPSDHAGSVLRLRDDGRVPSDNPFGEVYSYGHRNPQGMVYDELSGSVWVNEHGAKGGDEINRLESGANYGWPVISYGTHYNGAKIGEGTRKPGMEQPELYWDPSIAPSGMAVYTGNAFPGWDDDFFVGALAGRHLRRVERSGADVTGREEVLLQGVIGRIRDVRTGPDGLLYLLTDERNGGLYRLEPAD